MNEKWTILQVTVDEGLKLRITLWQRETRSFATRVFSGRELHQDIEELFDALVEPGGAATFPALVGQTVRIRYEGGTGTAVDPDAGLHIGHATLDRWAPALPAATAAAASGVHLPEGLEALLGDRAAGFLENLAALAERAPALTFKDAARLAEEHPEAARALLLLLTMPAELETRVLAAFGAKTRRVLQAYRALTPAERAELVQTVLATIPRAPEGA